MFINYSRDNGVTISTFRNASAYAGDLSDVLEAVAKDGAAVCCDLDGAKDALRDGAYLASVKADQDAVEAVYNAIVESETVED